MKLNIKKSEILLMIMDFLKQENMYKTLISLEKESGMTIYQYNRELAFLRQLIIDGQWDDAEEFLKPLKEHPNFEYNSSIFEIRKQKFMEAVENDSDNSNVDILVNMLKDLQNRCPNIIFKELCFCLTLSSITDHPEYKLWTPLSGRLKCFEKLRINLQLVYPTEKSELKIENNSFYMIMKNIITKSIDKLPLNKDKDSYTLSLFDEELTKESNDLQLSYENDYKQSKKKVKEENEVFINNNSTLKALRNEKISQSLNINKMGENEVTTNKPDKLSSKNVVCSDIEEVKEYDSKHYSQNELSDLDKEEYYMKSCYEYFEYDISTLKEKGVIEDSHPIRTSCFSPKGDYFSIGTNSRSLKVFHIQPIVKKFNKKNSYNFKNVLESNKENDEIKLCIEQKNHHSGSIYCLDWSVSGRLIASGSNDKTVKLMVVPDLEDEYGLKEQETLELSLKGHEGTVRSVCFEPTSDLVLLSAGIIDKCVKVWDTEKGTNTMNLEGHTGDIFTIKLSNDGQLCASSGTDKTIRFWDLRDNKSISLINSFKYTEINDISVFTRNKTISSTFVVAGHNDGKITVWDYNKKILIKELEKHKDEVRSVSFSPDGKYLVSASFDSTIKIFDVDRGFSNVGMLEHNDRVVSVKWHPEVPLLISTSADKTARIWIPEC